MNELKQLFVIELSFEKGKPRVLDAHGRTGEYLGSGVGMVNGERINGRVQWDLFEKVEETICESNLRGLIETEDGAVIQFDTLGFFRRPAHEDNPIWVNASAVTFHTENGRYNWLNTVTGVWHGTFDMSAYQHHYQVYSSLAGVIDDNPSN